MLLATFNGLGLTAELKKFLGAPRFGEGGDNLDGRDLRREGESYADANLLTVRSMKDARFDSEDMGGAKLLPDFLFQILDSDNNFKTNSFWTYQNDEFVLVKGFSVERYEGEDADCFTVKLDNSLPPYGVKANGGDFLSTHAKSNFEKLGVKVVNAEEVLPQILRKLIRDDMLAGGSPYRLPLDDDFWQDPEQAWARAVVESLNTAPGHEVGAPVPAAG